MSSRRLPALFALLGVVVAVVLFFALQDDTADEPTEVDPTPAAEQPSEQPAEDESKPEPPLEPDVPTLVVEGGQPKGGVEEIEVVSGEEIRFIVESDVAEEVHLHGYDVSKDVSAGGTVEFRVPATIEGVFEVELERSVVPIAEISVVPS